MTQTKQNIKRIVDRIDSLPTLPQVLSKLEKLLQNPKTSAAEVNSLISSDQVVTAKILKLVNSAFYGFPGQISTVTHAIVILGFKAVKSIALSASVFDMFLEDKGRSGFSRKGFWEHSIGVAVITRVIARKVQYGEEEEAFVAGLIHDIGKVVLDHYSHEDLIACTDCMEKENLLFIEAEKKTLGFTHEDIGAWLSEHWQLPEQLKDAISYHHNPPMAKSAFKLTAMVHLGNILCQSLGIGLLEGKRMPRLNPEAWKILELNTEDISEIMNDIDKELEKAQVYFALANKSPEQKKK